MRKDSIRSANATTATLDGVARDNSLSVVWQPLEMESPPDTERVGAARLKRVCILDEGQIKLARKQPIHLSQPGSLGAVRRLSDLHKYVYVFYGDRLHRREGDKMSTGTAASSDATHRG